MLDILAEKGFWTTIFYLDMVGVGDSSSSASID